MNYNIHEIFYSIQGEGLYTGTPMAFIRLAGCNLNCEFCDTDYSTTNTLNQYEISTQLREKFPLISHVVITGGEPTIQDLSYLIDHLTYLKGYRVHLETNGTGPIPPSTHWITLSPKWNSNVLPESIRDVDEIKFLYGPGRDEEILDFVSLRCKPSHLKPENQILWVMPLADGRNINQENTKGAIDFVKRNPRFRLCLQIHKYLDIP